MHSRRKRRAKLANEAMNQRPIGGRIHFRANALFSHAHGEIGRKRLQFAACELGGGGDFDFRSGDDAPLFFFGDSQDALLFGRGVLFGGAAHRCNFRVEAREAGFNFSKATVGFLTGLAGILDAALNFLRATTEHARQTLFQGKKDQCRQQRKIEDHRDPISQRGPHADLSRHPLQQRASKLQLLLH